ncbi:MAG: cadherin-like beta sandwich domain-containing protein, partial [Tenericutes bacterium]|nr:cadherin-like beta sandwich domain-containing protein [Mycoplasmatota bacterium]
REKDTDNTLKSLSLTNCTLSPTFNGNTTSYTCTVENNVTETTVTAIATSSVATVTGAGTKQLAVGTNTINITVTSQSGSIKTYQVVVTRKASSDATLKSLTVSNGTLTPEFDGSKTEYTVSVPYNVSTVTVAGAANSSEATVTGAGSKSLTVGANTITVTVTAGDKTEKTYTITITREKDTDNTLKSLNLTSCTLTPTFASGTTAYACTVANSVTETTVTASATSSVATVSGTGKKALSVGSNTINVTVTSQSGATKIYTIMVTRLSNSDASLKSLTVSSGTLTPTFDGSKTEYTVSVPYSVDSITITGEATASTSNVTGLGSKVLEVGENTFSVVVTAEDKTTIRTYTITVTRQKDTDTSLKSIGVTGYNIVKVDNNNYTLTVENNVTSAEITATATSSVATVSGTGKKTLSVGANTFKVIVTAQNGSISAYNVVITRKASSDATLKSLTVSTGTLSPAFSSTTTSYAVSVPYSVSAITIAASANNSEATVSGAGTKQLSVGANTITVTVTAGDKTTKTYTITVTREKDTDNNLKSLGLTSCTLSPTFASGTTSYTCTVANNVTETTVTAESTSGVATIAGTGKKTLNVGNNAINVVVTSQSGATKTYTVTVHRKSNDATLSSLSVTGYTLTPTFTSSTTNYALTVPSSVSSITVNATKNHSAASVSGTGTKTLVAGLNAIKVTVTAEDGNTNEYVINVKRMTVDTVSLTAVNTTYTGSAIGANTATAKSGTAITYTYYQSTDCTGTTLSGAPTNAGNYSVRATSKGNSDYESGSICAKHTITQGTPTISLNKKDATYTGSQIGSNAATAKNPNGTAVTLSYTYTYYSGTSCSGTALSGAPTNAGSYSVKATSAATANLKSATSSCVTLTIGKKNDTVNLTAKTATYTGSQIGSNAAATASGTTITYTYYSTTDCTGTALSGAPTNVGNYSVKATSAGNTNYNSGSTCAKHTITQGTPTISLTNKEATYTGSAISTNAATAKNPNGTAVTLSYTYAYYSGTSCSGTALSGAPTNVGSYSVKATSAATTNLKSATSSCAVLTIGKANDTVTLTEKTATYTGSAIEANKATSVSGSAITYTYYSSCGGTALSGAPTNAGTYGVIATSAGNANYNGASSACVKHTITQANNPISVTASQSWTPTFDTTAQSKTITGATNAQGSVTYAIVSQKNAGGTTISNFTLSGTSLTMAGSTGVGTYTVVIRATAAGNGNYKAGSKDITVTITVGIKTITVPSSPAAKTYNGASQGSGISCPTGTTAGGTTSATDVATYTQTCTPSSNYKWSDGTTTAKSISWVISPKSIAVSWGTTTFTYNGSGQAPTASAASGVTGETINVTRTTATNAGSYTSTASCSSVT